MAIVQGAGRQIIGAYDEVGRADAALSQVLQRRFEQAPAEALATPRGLHEELGDESITAGELDVVAEGGEAIADETGAHTRNQHQAQATVVEQAVKGGDHDVGVPDDGFALVERLHEREDV